MARRPSRWRGLPIAALLLAALGPAGCHRPAKEAQADPAPGRAAARRCLGGHLDACVAIARGAARSGQLREAGAVYDKACSAGSAAACLGLAKLYHHPGFHRPPFLPSATDLRRRAELFDEVHCRAGDGPACKEAAWLLDLGIRGPGDEHSDPEALRKRACRLGVRAACGKG